MFYKIILCLSLTFWASLSYAKNLSVVATIKPIHALVSGVMKDVGTPTLLVDGANSPHGFYLKPSQMRAIYNADHVFYVHPTVEGFLKRIIPTQPKKFTLLSESNGLKIHHMRNDEHWEKCEDEDHIHDDHQNTAIDPHIWLSSHNAKILLDKIALTLANSDPDNAKTYYKNADHYKKRIENIDFSALKPYGKKNFIVFHDAYQYFEKEHHLSGVGAITIDPQLPAKPRKLSRTRQHIKDMNVSCVFKEPQFSNKLIDVVVNDSRVNIGMLDPLGGTLKAGEDLYIHLLQDMRDNFISCFE